MCDHCYYDESERYKAELCPDCAEKREPSDGEVMQAFTYQCKHLCYHLAKISELQCWDIEILKTALAEIAERISMMDQEPPSEIVQKQIRAEIRRLAPEERPWRKLPEAGVAAAWAAARAVARAVGTYYTPPEVMKVVDPALGSGGFLNKAQDEATEAAKEGGA